MKFEWCRGAAVSLAGASLAAIFLLVPRPAVAQDSTTPMKDGHPDFNGDWLPGGAPAPGGTATQQFQRDSDGSNLSISRWIKARHRCVWAMRAKIQISLPITQNGWPR